MAVKIVPSSCLDDPQQQGEGLAALASSLAAVEHPNIVRVHCWLPCAMEQQPGYGGQAGGRASQAGGAEPPLERASASSALPLPLFRRLQPGEQAGGGWGVLVTECCEGGTLRQGMSLGLLHPSRPGSGSACQLADLPVMLEVGGAGCRRTRLVLPLLLPGPATHGPWPQPLPPARPDLAAARPRRARRCC